MATAAVAGTAVVAVVAEPAQALFTPAVPGTSRHNLINKAAGAMAVKVRCSDNTIYKVRPVFAVVAGGGRVALEVGRSAAPAKQDKLVIQSLACAAETGLAGVGALFKAAGAAPVCSTVALVAADAPAAAPEAAPAEKIAQDQLDQYDQPPPIQDWSSFIP